MPQFIVLPAADVTAGSITTLANAVLRPSAALTGLTNGTPYRAVRTSLSPSFTPVSAIATDFGSHTLVQYTPITAIDLAGFMSPGDRVFSNDLPDGLEVMTTRQVMLGGAIATQSATDHAIWVQTAAGDVYEATINITVNAPAGRTVTVSTVAALYALVEFGNSYSGPGCTVNLAAGATFDITAFNNNNRFQGLTSQLIIKSADLADRATITGKNWALSTNQSGIVGNVSLVDIDIHVNQVGTPVAYGGTLLPAFVINVGGSNGAERAGFFGLKVTSDVDYGTAKIRPKQQMVGINFAVPTDAAVVYGCDFSDMFNGVQGAPNDFLLKNAEIYNSWGDAYRPSVNNTNDIATNVLVDALLLRDPVADGSIRHPDLIQMTGGGGSVDKVFNGYEQRGTISLDGLTVSLPTVSPPFQNANAVVASVDTTAGNAHSNVLYRLETDVAGSDLTLTLPDITTVGANFDLTVQKYSGDKVYKITVTAFGTDTVGGSATYEVGGAWKAVRVHRVGAATDWSVSVFGKGIQVGLYQDDGGLIAVNSPLVHHCLAATSQFSYSSWEVNAVGARIENLTGVVLMPEDIDGDGIIDDADGVGNPNSPAITLRNLSSTASMTVERSIAASIFSNNQTPGAFTVLDSDSNQLRSTPLTVTSRFVGEGREPSVRDEAVLFAQHKPGGPLDGTGRGAVAFGPSTLGYDFVNRRMRIPGAPTCSTAAVIALNAGLYEITTTPVSSAGGTFTRQWRNNNAPVVGQTGTTIAQSLLSAGTVTCRFTQANVRGPLIVESAPLTV